MWRSEIMCTQIQKYRGSNDHVQYDYTRHRAEDIPHISYDEQAKADIYEHAYGMQHWIIHKFLHAKGVEAKTGQLPKIGIGVAGNSGVPFGAVALNTPNSAKQLESKIYNTQEEDIVRSWILTELHWNKDATIPSCLSKLKMDDGTWVYGLTNLSDTNTETNWETRQGINYTNLKLSKDIRPDFPIERLYADAYIIRNAPIAPKTKEGHDFTSKEYSVPVTMSFVSGPQANIEIGGYAYSTTRRTFNKHAHDDYNHFRNCVKWTYYACLHSLAMEGCTIVLLPWISGASYAGPHIDTYGVQSDGQEVINIVNEVLSMRAYDKSHHKTTLGHFFTDVGIYTISYGPKRSLGSKSEEPPSKKLKSASSWASASSSASALSASSSSPSSSAASSSAASSSAPLSTTTPAVENVVKHWKSLKNKVSLTNKNNTQTIHGKYEFNPSTMILNYVTNGIKGSSKVSVVSSENHPYALKYKEMEKKIKTLSEIGITQIVGSINTEIAKPSTYTRVFVLPSQLNAAEYPSKTHIVQKVDDYKYDLTGGPRGQLAGDPAVAQFILDNASNDHNPDGINNVRSMDLQNIHLKNGYLIPTKDGTVADRKYFEEQLQHMTILGMQDVNVTGIVSGDYNVFSSSPHKVDLIYASAMPLTLDYGVHKSDHNKFLAKMVLMGQYVASMKWAIQRTNCDLILMPLGGGVFQNEFSTIKIAMAAAYEMMEDHLKVSNVRVFVLAWVASDKEINEFI